jgi:hypothetical protein
MPGPIYCDLCGVEVDRCLCLTCPVCGAKGDPACYPPGGHDLDGIIERSNRHDEAAELADARLAHERESE